MVTEARVEETEEEERVVAARAAVRATEARVEEETKGASMAKKLPG